MTKSKLKAKVADLKYKIQMISSLGGIVPDSLKEELIKIEVELLKSTEDSCTIEESFKQEYRRVRDEIQVKLEKINVAMKEVIDLSERTGIPFKSKIRIFDDKYFPASFNKKTAELDYEFVADLLQEDQLWSSGTTGWQHSMISC